ncbi:maleylpyruvate isomerase family mycothiol-dependent enzyme [Actinomadura sp. NPDC047616]|uniref:maleylpyruvate isomerase family mycothiol-dependent enzyme n=1 Tax=Actinomadura sp. NPDC047616 TaxID=3155914 RepID=UPI00340F4C93
MTDFSWLGRPIDARHLFAPERRALLTLLRDLDPAGWAREAVPGWTVKDVAAHLLGDDYGRLAHDRDGHQSHRTAPEPSETFEAFIHRINQQWVDAADRLSTRSLVETLEMTGRQIADLWQRSDPHGSSRAVSWAGADPAPLWLDCARDYTEYWTHRQQIRLAVGLEDERPPEPLLDTFMRALPHTLRDVAADEGTQVQVRVDGLGAWTATAIAEGWSLAPPPSAAPAAVVHLDPVTAWRLCVRMVQPDVAVARARMEGDTRLGAAACRILSIIR